ncbi:MAG: C40 family peptidase [Alicyclobacillus sp.]|nr:C40 family peptidase [Alicyclobacillus sp.]
MQTYRQAQLILVERTRRALADVKQNIQTATRRTTLLESQIQLTQAQIQQIESETQKAQQLMQDPTYVQQQRAALGNADPGSLLKYAETFIGTPYVWGGTSPSGFDCSGFTQYVFAHFGVNLNRTSEDQFAQGIPVSQSDLQPGDLVFFSTYAPGATHVGIYMGNGMMIDAEDSGVIITSMSNSYWASRYIGARQVLQS